ncbi:hypothetical protein YC2023_115174 [Brassica napus]
MKSFSRSNSKQLIFCPKIPDRWIHDGFPNEIVENSSVKFAMDTCVGCGFATPLNSS